MGHSILLEWMCSRVFCIKQESERSVRFPTPRFPPLVLISLLECPWVWQRRCSVSYCWIFSQENFSLSLLSTGYTVEGYTVTILTFLCCHTLSFTLNNNYSWTFLSDSYRGTLRMKVIFVLNLIYRCNQFKNFKELNLWSPYRYLQLWGIVFESFIYKGEKPFIFIRQGRGSVSPHGPTNKRVPYSFTRDDPPR